MLSPDYLDSLSQGQKWELLQSEDFINACLGNDTDPYVALGLDILASSSEKCIMPIVVDRFNVDTEEVSEYIIACKSSNSLKCPSCSELNARLRQRHMMEGMKGCKVAMLTGTAPTWGRVHRASFTKKDEFKARKVHASKREAHKLMVMKKKGKCPCGRYHDYTDPKVGFPLNPSTYNYAKEIIWSENLPALQKAMTRKIKYLAKNLGISPQALSLYTVYERQKRGSLHTHTLIVVNNDEAGFQALIAEIKMNWKTLHNPTAEIPPQRVAFYRSKDASTRWKTYAPHGHADRYNPRQSIPLVRWKKGHAKPGTEFGSVFDIRILESNNNAEGEIDGHQQASAYLAKYLTKNQSATSYKAMHKLSALLSRHYSSLRRASLALTGDRIINEALYANCEKELQDLESTIEGLSLTASSDEDYKNLEKMEKLASDAFQELRRLDDAVQTGETSGLLDLLFPDGSDFTIDRKAILDASSELPNYLKQFRRQNLRRTNKSIAERVRKASRGLAIRLNKSLDNAGFTGSLTSISNWVTSMTDLRNEMIAYTRTGKAVDLTEYTWEINLSRMRELIKERRIPQKVPDSNLIPVTQAFPLARLV